MSDSKDDVFDMSTYSDEHISLKAPMSVSGSSVNVSPLDPYSMFHNLVSRAGWAYLSGLAVGSVAGAASGVVEAKKTPAIANSGVLFRNHVVNSMGRQASSLGNHCGTFAVVYSVARGLLTRRYPDNLKIADSFAVGAGSAVLHLFKGPIVSTLMFGAGTLGGFTFFSILEKTGLTKPVEEEKMI